MLKQRTTGGAALLACIVVTTASAAQAKDLYVCDCGPGAHPECQPGSDENPGDSVDLPLQSWDRARDFVRNEAECGDRILFCQGGQFAATAGNRWYSGTLDCQDDPIITGSYRPGWTDDALAAPIIETPGTAFTYDGNSNGGGYVFQDLDVRCRKDGGSCGRDDSNGFFLLSTVHHVTIQRVRVDGFQQGIHMNAWDGPPTDVTIRKSVIVNNSRQGVLGGADRLQVVDNYVMNNGCIGAPAEECKFDHNLYISGVRQDMLIRGNVLSGAARDPEGNCHGAEIVLRGGERVTVENNLLYQPPGRTDPHCFGITGTADIDGVRNGCVDCTIRNNRFENVSNAIDLLSIQRTTIENNHIVFPHTEGRRGNCSGIHVAASSSGMLADGDMPTDAVTVRNNAIYFGRDGECYGIRVAEQGSEHAITDNAIYAGGPASVRCLEMASDPASFGALANNLCFAESGETRWNGDADVAVMEAEYGGNGNQVVDPGFHDPEANDLSPGEGSPLAGGEPVGAELAPDPEGLAIEDEEFALIRAEFPDNPRGGVQTVVAPAGSTGAVGAVGDYEPSATSQAAFGSTASGQGCSAVPGAETSAAWFLIVLGGLFVTRRRRLA